MPKSPLPNAPLPLAPVGMAMRFIRRFDQVNRPLIEAQRKAHGPDIPVVHIRSTAEAERFLLGPRQ